ncbi:Sensor protein ZraS [compost metagenome]
MQKNDWFLFVCFLLSLLLAAPQVHGSVPFPVSPPAKKTYKIAAEWALPPFSYVAANGSLTGASIDIMEKIAAYNNIVFEYIPMDLAQAEKELRAGKIDAIAGLTYSARKNKMFDFSDPYFTMSDTLIVPNKKRNSIRSMSDIRNSHVVLQNREAVVESLFNLRHTNLTITDNQLSGLLALLQGRADVFIGNKWTADVYLQHFKQQDSFAVLEIVVEPADFAIAVRKGNDPLLNVMNKTLAVMKTKGEISAIINDWLTPGFAVQINRLQHFIQLLMIVLGATACILLFIYIWNQRLKKAVQERTKELSTLNGYLQEQRQQVADRDAFKEQILNNIHTGIVTFDLNFSLTSSNSRAEEMLHSSREAPLSIQHSPLLARIIAHDKDIRDRKEKRDDSLTKLEINEQEEWKVIYYRLLTLYDAQKRQTGYLLSMTDRTEEKRLEQKLIVQEKLHALGQLVAGIAHEIRNPLTSIKTFVEVMPDKYDQPHFRQAMMEYIPAEIDRLNAIVTDLLDYARPRSPSQEKYPANALLSSLLTLLRVTVEKKHICMEHIVHEDLVFYIDPQQIRQVFLNLLLNAIDAVEQQPTKKIIVTVERESAVTGKVTITDTGSGIAPEQIKRIFEPFYTSKHNGVGLGLPLSYKLTKENEGDLRIASGPGQGTTVTVLLPLYTQEDRLHES